MPDRAGAMRASGPGLPFEKCDPLQRKMSLVAGDVSLDARSKIRAQRRAAVARCAAQRRDDLKNSAIFLP
jgi:hypothetical protein